LQVRGDISGDWSRVHITAFSGGGRWTVVGPHQVKKRKEVRVTFQEVGQGLYLVGKRIGGETVGRRDAGDRGSQGQCWRKGGKGSNAVGVCRAEEASTEWGVGWSQHG